MPHVSKNKLERELSITISARLINVLTDFNTKSDMLFFLDDLLTRTEKIMLAKRLAIAIMLDKHYPFNTISRLLKVSESTICAMRERIDRNGRGYALALTKLENKGSIKNLLKIMDKFIGLSNMPPKYGKTRWNFLDKVG